MFSTATLAQDEKKPQQVLFTNCNIFDGKADKLDNGKNVLVEDNLIKTIGDKTLKANDGTTVVECGGRTLLPGLIDMHSHLGLQMPGIAAVENALWEEIAANTVIAAERWLMDGFTTVRDAGGMSGKGVKKLVDRGDLPGPRIYPSGAIFSQTSGHADTRTLSARNPLLSGVMDSNIERLDIAHAVDGRDSILGCCEAQSETGCKPVSRLWAAVVLLRSMTPALHGLYYRRNEGCGGSGKRLRHLRDVTSQSAVSIQRALEAGVISIEHGFAIDEETIQMLVDKGAYLSTQLTGTSEELFKLPSLTSENRWKLGIAREDMKNYFPLVKKYKPKQVFAIDAVLTTHAQADQQRAHEIWLFGHHFGNLEFLKAATSTAGELLAKTGDLNPYPLGPIGIIEQGAYADLLVVDGNTLEDLASWVPTSSGMTRRLEKALRGSSSL